MGRKELTEAEINKLIMVDESGRGSHELSVEVLLTEIARSLAVIADSIAEKEEKKAFIESNQPFLDEVHGKMEDYIRQQKDSEYLSEHGKHVAELYILNCRKIIDDVFKEAADDKN